MWRWRWGQPGFFDPDERYRRLSENGDPLARLSEPIDFERLRLAAALKCSDGSGGSRPAYDPVVMFKTLILQTLYTLSDDATEFQIRDRLSFMGFLRLGLEDPVPDAMTIRLLREHLTRADAIEDLFAEFDAWLKGKGYPAMSGRTVDAGIVAAPRRRTTDEEKSALKEGRIPEGWAGKPIGLRQKDHDARRTLKRAGAREDGAKAKVETAMPVFGYKHHIGHARAHGSVRRSAVTGRPGRHRISLQGQREAPGEERPEVQNHFRRKPRRIAGPLSRRGRFCSREIDLWPVRPNHRSCRGQEPESGRPTSPATSNDTSRSPPGSPRRRMKSAAGTTPQHRQGQNDRTQSSNINRQNSATHPTNRPSSNSSRCPSATLPLLATH